MLTLRMPKLYLSTFALLISTLACRAATRLVIPDTPTPLPPTATPTITVSPTIPPPTATPLLEAACPVLLTDIMNAATAKTESSGEFEDEEDIPYLVIYTITDDKLGQREDIFAPDELDIELDSRASHEFLWNYFAAIIPVEERDFVTEFSVISDGRNHILAGVSPTYDSPNEWSLKVDIVDASDRYNLTYTLMHEFGHFLTLKPSQVSPDRLLFYSPEDKDIYERALSACPRYFTGEGCSNADSYINEFFNRFWTGFYAEWQEIDSAKGEDGYHGMLNAFYKIYQDQFLTDYASTSPEEDMAEAWAFFILSPKPELTSIANEKILFFYEYPELVQLRQEILTRLCVEFPHE
jgi:hypothetical protein